MRVFCILAFLACSITAFSRADTHEITKTTVAGNETVFARYVQGKNMRFESRSQDGSRQFVTIRNAERKGMYFLDLPSQTYVESQPQSPDWILSLAQWIARPPRTRESGKTVNIYYETIDTGERKTFFGYTARHLRLRERRVAEPGACDGTYQTERDGWYIPAMESNTAKGSYLIGDYILAGSYSCHDTVVTHGDPSSPGLPVLETNGSFTREVLELSHDPLDKSLFEVPGDFRKVEALPGHQPMSWSQHLQMEWSQLEHAFQSWFE